MDTNKHKQKILSSQEYIDQKRQEQTNRQQGESYNSFPVGVFNNFLGFGGHNNLNKNEITTANIPQRILPVNNPQFILVFLDITGIIITAVPSHPADKFTNSSDSVINILPTASESIKLIIP